MFNHQHSLHLRRSRFDWAAFDALPTYAKEICWEFNVHWAGRGRLSPELCAAQRDKLESRRRDACRETYGMDHPGAQVSFCDADFLV